MKGTSPAFGQDTEAVAGHQKHALNAQLPTALADEAVAVAVAVAEDRIGNQLQHSESGAGYWES